ncbi:hypothetical protein M378DRAFT_160798, partial [Amanita muscaria Koide BX008]
MARIYILTHTHDKHADSQGDGQDCGLCAADIRKQIDKIRAELQFAEADVAFYRALAAQIQEAAPEDND